jgi:arsenate reductase
MKARIYHNPRCSKSRATLALLEDRGVEVEIVDYLAAPPTRAELEELLARLGTPAAAIVRMNEAEFSDSGLSPDAPAPALLDLIARQPRLLQRPIVVVGDRARIGRPPEQVLGLFE